MCFIYCLPLCGKAVCRYVVHAGHYRFVFCEIIVGCFYHYCCRLAFFFPRLCYYADFVFAVFFEFVDSDVVNGFIFFFVVFIYYSVASVGELFLYCQDVFLCQFHFWHVQHETSSFYFCRFWLWCIECEIARSYCEIHCCRFFCYVDKREEHCSVPCFEVECCHFVLSGERVSCKGVAIGEFVCFDYVEVLMISVAVHNVFLPHVFVHVDVPYEQSCARQCHFEFIGSLSVFEYEILLSVSVWHCYSECFVFLCEYFCREVLWCWFYFCVCEPSQFSTFEC